MFSTLKISEILRDHNIQVLFENETLFVVATDLSEYLNLTNIRTSIAGFQQHEKTIKKIQTKGGPQNKTVLTVSGITRLLCNSRM